MQCGKSGKSSMKNAHFFMVTQNSREIVLARQVDSMVFPVCGALISHEPNAHIFEGNPQN